MIISPVLLIPGARSIVQELFRCDICIVIGPLYYYRDATGRDRFVCGQHRPQ